MTATAQQIHCPANMYCSRQTTTTKDAWPDRHVPHSIHKLDCCVMYFTQPKYLCTDFLPSIIFVSVPLPRTSGRENWSTTIIKSYLIPRWVSGFDLSIGALVFLSNKGIGTSLAFIRHSASANKDLLIILHKKTQKVENTSIVLSFNPLWTKEMLSEQV